MSIFRVILDICILRGRPQDLPASSSLVWLAAAATVAADYARVLLVGGRGSADVLIVAAQAIIFGGVVWAVLKMRGFPERWPQTITALYAANAVFTLVTLPMASQVVEASKQALEALQGGAPVAVGWELPAATAADIWFLMVMAQVMRHATELSFARSAIVSFLSLLTAGVVELVVVALVTAPAQS